MLKKIVITNYLGESMTFDIEGVQQDRNVSGLLISEVEGLGPVQANVNMTDLSIADGSLFNSARLEKRNIVISAYFTGSKSVEESRLLSYKYFPLKRKLRFYIETSQRKAYVDGYVESNEPDIFQKYSTCRISILCESAYFTSDEGAQYIKFSATVPSFRFKYKNEGSLPVTRFGEIQHKTRQEIVYEGDGETGLTITIDAVGNAKNFVIYDITKRQFMNFNTDRLASILPSEDTDNDKLIFGDRMIITTHQKNKKITLIRGGISYNALNLLDKNPEWLTVSKGINEYMYYAESGDENLRITIEAPVQYEGV